MLIAKFTYKNAKNASIGHTLFELNYGDHLWILYKEKLASYFKSKIVEELLVELKELIIVYYKNPYYTYKLSKQAYNKSVKPKSYIFNNKVWLYNKYIKTKLNQKLEARFFDRFIFYILSENKLIKLELPR